MSEEIIDKEVKEVIKQVLKENSNALHRLALHEFYEKIIDIRNEMVCMSEVREHESWINGVDYVLEKFREYFHI